MTRYAHARPGEHCTQCNDLAVRVVAARALCVDHFDHLVGAIHRRVRWRLLTPPESPADAPRWRQELAEAVEHGIIPEHDARTAWNNWNAAA